MKRSVLFLAAAALLLAISSANAATPQSKNFPATEYRVSYRVDASLLVTNKEGKKVLPEKLGEIHRTLPPVGTQWTYVSGHHKPTSLTLTSVKEGQAHYAINNGKTHMAEHVATYHRINNPASPHLHFPLHPGDHWKGQFEASYRIPTINDGSVPVEEKGTTYSEVVGVTKAHVPAGTFTTYVIDRNIGWIKKDPAVPKDQHNPNDPDHLDHPIRGFTREIMYYAPQVGRIVLQGQMSAGMQTYLTGTPAEFMRYAHVTTIKLQRFEPAK